MIRDIPALKIFALLALLMVPSVDGARAAEPFIPGFWDSRERLPAPAPMTRERLRFLTTIDFPPFNYLDSEGRLAGFHVDLARAICAELNIAPICQIQALPWGELEDALAKGDGEAIIAGIAVTKETRERYAFSSPYLRLPGRFLTARTSGLREPIYAALEGKRVGVIAGSAHERALRDLFPDARPVTYSRAGWMLDDLRDGKTDAVFGDGMRLSFWIAGTDSQGCCRFAGGPYLLPDYFGHGLSIAVRPGDEDLARAFDHALREIDEKGVFAELYLRYFPVGFF